MGLSPHSSGHLGRRWRRWCGATLRGRRGARRTLALTQALTRTLTPTLSLALTLTRCKQLTEAERIGQQVRAIGHLVITTFGDAVTWLSPLQVGAIGGVLKKGSLTFLDQRRCNNNAI